LRVFRRALGCELDSDFRVVAMLRGKSLLSLVVLIGLAGCASIPVKTSPRDADGELGLLRKQIEDIHGNRDVAAFGALHTETTARDWRGRPAIVGRSELERSTRDLWAHRRELRLNLHVGEIRIHADRAYEFGSYEETWIDAQGSRVTEFGRYATTYVQLAGTWKIERALGFSDVTATKRVAE
jgi:hypothetical protein